MDAARNGLLATITQPGVSFNRGTLNACSVLMPHVHPRVRVVPTWALLVLTPMVVCLTRLLCRPRRSTTCAAGVARCCPLCARLQGTSQPWPVQVISGNISVGLVQENGGTPITGYATTNSAFVVPQGLIHFMYNPVRTPRALLLAGAPALWRPRSACALRSAWGPGHRPAAEG